MNKKFYEKLLNYQCVINSEKYLIKFYYGNVRMLKTIVRFMNALSCLALLITIIMLVIYIICTLNLIFLLFLNIVCLFFILLCIGVYNDLKHNICQKNLLSYLSITIFCFLLFTLPFLAIGIYILILLILGVL